jgi:ssDNA-binding replication factor A large subunit
MLYQVKDLKKDSKRINIILKLVTRLEPRYAKGYKIITFVAADLTGTILVPFWNEDGNTVKVGDTIEIQNGYLSEFRDKLQLNVGKFGNFSKVESPDQFEAISSESLPKLAESDDSEGDGGLPISLEEFLAQRKGNWRLHLFISEQVTERTVHTKLDGKEHKISTFMVGDSSGCMQLDVWDEHAFVMEVGTSVDIGNAYVKAYKNRRYLNLGRNSSVTPLEQDVEINLKNNFSESTASAEDV